MQALIEFNDVSIAYQDQLALQHVTLTIPQGTQVAVVGPNGAGKSTLFKALVGLLPVREGQITIHGQSLHAHRDCVAYLPQHEEVDWRFPVTVHDVVMMGRMGHQGWFKFTSAGDNPLVEQCMRKMNVLDLSERPIGDLSGGQQQRVFLARALAQEPHILLMDEPFTGVDQATQETTLELLKELKADNVTVMVSTHDLNMARQYFETILVINKEVIAFGDAQVVFNQNTIQRAFGPHLLTMNDLILVDDCCSHDEGIEEAGHDMAH
jgi:ABC-type Mn2+/Zn2+ transport system ATPase subunit